jgi:hypothetical protein
LSTNIYYIHEGILHKFIYIEDGEGDIRVKPTEDSLERLLIPKDKAYYDKDLPMLLKSHWEDLVTLIKKYRKSLIKFIYDGKDSSGPIMGNLDHEAYALARLFTALTLYNSTKAHLQRLEESSQE